MTRFPAFLLAACILAACSGNPFAPTVVVSPPLDETEQPATPDPGAASALPSSLAQNLSTVSYNADTNTLVMRLTSLNA